MCIIARKRQSNRRRVILDLLARYTGVFSEALGGVPLPPRAEEMTPVYRDNRSIIASWRNRDCYINKVVLI